MHEMAYAEGILGVALEVSDGSPVRRVQVRLGALHRIVPESLQFCFQLAAQDTAAADALLDVTEIPVRVRCARCGAESDGGAPPFQCAACDVFDVRIVSGEEVLVDAVELDDGWRRRSDHLREHALAESSSPTPHTDSAGGS
jgi:hydrogenase nickel incorporation protein HypA/HybF